MKTKLAVKNKKSHKARLQLVDRLQAMDKPEPVTEQYDVSFLTYSQKNINRTLYIPPKKCTVQGKVLWDLPGLTLMSGQNLLLQGIMELGRLAILIMLIQLSLATIERATFNSRTQIVKMMIVPSTKWFVMCPL